MPLPLQLGLALAAGRARSRETSLKSLNFLQLLMILTVRPRRAQALRLYTSGLTEYIMHSAGCLANALRRCRKLLDHPVELHSKGMTRECLLYMGTRLPAHLC